MKKYMFILFSAAVTLLLSACAGGSAGSVQKTDDQETGEGTVHTVLEKSISGTGQKEENVQQEYLQDSRILVAYFSWADNAVQDHDMDAVTSPSVTVPGNVAQLAGWVSEQTGGDLFSIRVTEPYSCEWDECLSRANQEKADGEYPVLLEKVEDFDSYDTVFLGYPNWWYSCPMAVISFIDEYEFRDKHVYLFCSHGTGGLAGSVKDIAQALPDAVLSEDVFHVYEDDTASAEDDIRDWLKRQGY